MSTNKSSNHSDEKDAIAVCLSYCPVSITTSDKHHLQIKQNKNQSSLTSKLRLAFMDITSSSNNNNINNRSRNHDPNHINFDQFKQAFIRVFGDGIHQDSLIEIFNGFINSIPSSYTVYNSTINYQTLLKDPRLKRILLILHNYTMTSIKEIHNDCSQKLGIQSPPNSTSTLTPNANHHHNVNHIEMYENEANQRQLIVCYDNIK